ncbi:MAG TPA: substrate-binding domain-containing protein [Atribacter sp.]|uniref:sugar ABC transporter substrate-binding protein n=1 Tax=Atribacter sp. TaxID=2847780 RepID=UPI002BD4CA60|nr:substrate-binding domain-containing protein [Atribacter sp.]HQK84301.1 substrate-binding domain-containing protein [Atribacter sp.]
MKKIFLSILVCIIILAVPSAFAEETKTVAVITPYLASVTTNQMIKAFEREAKSKGWNVVTVDTKGDFGALASRMEDMIARKVDAIVLGSADPNQLKDQIKKSNEAGIPVLGADAGWIPGVTCNVTSDNYVMSAMMTTFLFNAIDRKGNIVVFTHRPHHGVRKRTLILDAILIENPDIKVITEHHVQVPGPIEDARKAMESILIANPQPGSIQAVWAGWDEPAIGATQAIIAAGRQNEIVVAGVDGTSQAIELIEKGTPLIATVSQDFEGMMVILVEQLERIFSGKNPISIEVYTPSKLIYKE